jgi:hypothetical protein
MPARRFGLIALLAVGALALIFAIRSPDEGVAGSAKATVVGKVTAVAGKGLTVKSEGGREHQLKNGDVLYLGDVIDPDKGVRATLQLEPPSGVSGDADLVFISPGKGDEHTVTVERTGPSTTTVQIGD